MAANEISKNAFIDLDVRNNHVLSRWLVDIVYLCAWEQFQETSCIEPDSLRDLIQGVLHRPLPDERDAETQQKVFLLLLMCCLTDGENFKTRYSEESDITPLENVDAALSNLVRYLPSSLSSDCQLIKEAVQHQAVLTCCREGDFHTAKSVFDRLQKTNSNNCVNKLKTVLDSQDPCHFEITNNTYNSLLEMIKTFLEQIFSMFEEPFIIKVLKAYMVEKSKLHTPPPSSGSIHGSPSCALKMKKVMVTTAASELDVHMDSSALSGQVEGLGCILQDKRQKTAEGIVSNCLSYGSVDDRKTKDTEESSIPNSGVKSPRKRKIIESIRDAKINLQNATHQLTTDLNNHARKTSPERTACINPNSCEIRKFRYRKHIRRVNRHQAKSLDSSSSSSSEDTTSHCILGDSSLQLPRSSRFRSSLQPRSPSIRSKTSTPISVTNSSPGKGKRVWEKNETEEFYKAVKEHGVGNWAIIRDSLDSIRTNVQMKDKWRTMTRNGQARILAVKLGPVPNTKM